jgi:hypothetical protein
MNVDFSRLNEVSERYRNETLKYADAYKFAGAKVFNRLFKLTVEQPLLCVGRYERKLLVKQARIDYRRRRRELRGRKK